MAVSGTVSVSTGNSKYSAWVSWRATQSITNNTSTISATLYVKGSDSTAVSGSTISAGSTLSVAGVSKTSSTSFPRNGQKSICSITAVVNHNDDGSAGFRITVAGQGGGGEVVLSANSWITLDTIARQATLLTAPSFNDEQNPSITYSNPAGETVSALQACISLNGTAADIAWRSISKTGSTYTFELTDAEREVLRQATTTSNSRTVYFIIATTIGDNTWSNSLGKTLTIVNATPTLAPTAVDTNEATLALTGSRDTVVKYCSILECVVNAAAYKGATISSCKIECGNSAVNSSSATFSNVETDTVKFTATDSRGNSVSKTLTKTFIDYLNPTCNLTIGMPTVEGIVEFTASGNFYNGSFGSVENIIVVQYRYKEVNGEWCDWIETVVAAKDNTYSGKTTVSDLDYRKSYTFQLRAGDRLKESRSGEQTIRTKPIFDWGENDFKFNVPVNFAGGISTENKVLWEGVAYMTAEHKAVLSDLVSNQTAGIVLVFSPYQYWVEKPYAENTCFSYHFVPKIAVSLQNGKSAVFNMRVYDESYISNKKLYIYDDKIVGDDSNYGTGTGADGITYTNQRFVLRYVIGV